jgi:hypothetical protein
MELLDPWMTTPIEMEEQSKVNTYDQTAKVLHHTPQDGYQIIFRFNAVGRFQEVLPLGRYDDVEFLSRLRAVDGYGWWNVTTEGTWLPWEIEVLTKVTSPDTDQIPVTENSNQQNNAPSTNKITASTIHETDPWRLSLQLPPSDALASTTTTTTTTTTTAMLDIPVVRLYSTRATLLQDQDPINATYFDQQYLNQAMATQLQQVNYDAIRHVHNISKSFFKTSLNHRLYYWDRAMLKYEQSLYRKHNTNPMWMKCRHVSNP